MNFWTSSGETIFITFKIKLVKRLNIFIAILVVSAFVVSGCGKQENEVKVGGKQNISKEKKGNALTVSVTESSVKWLGKKVTGQHNGTIDISKGEVHVDNGKLTGGFVEMNMESIKNLDLTDKAMNDKLVNHLKSDDFFSAAKHPVSKFEITNVTEIKDPDKPNANATVTGNLTIKGITKSITFPAEIKIENNTLKFKADVGIDRTDWDVKYGSGKFFENLGDKMISDVFNLELSVTAK